MTSNKTLTSKKLRQRARFKCESCNENRLDNKQYAHMIPDIDDGGFSLSNMLFLCYSCHRKYEVEGLPKSSQKRKLLVDQMIKMRDKTKSDSPLKKFLNYPSEKVVLKTGNCTFRSSRIFTSTELSELKLLQIDVKNQTLILNALFFDKQKNLILSIKDNNLRTHSNLLFDLIISKNDKLEIISKDKTMKLCLDQDLEGILNVTGKIYYYGFAYELSRSRGLICNRATFNNCEFSNIGIRVSNSGLEGV